MIEAGIEVVEGSKELENDLRELGQPITDKWIAQMGEAGVDGQAVIDSYLARIAERTAAATN
jgi:TRAP-type C4-dicarboxylate transport system substrate-binding protein